MVDVVNEVTCIICGRKRPRGQCHVIELTAKESAAIRDMGQQPLTEYPYCQPCWKNITDPRTGPAFMGSYFEILLSRGGVGNSEKIASQFREWLTKRAMESKNGPD